MAWTRRSTGSSAIAGRCGPRTPTRKRRSRDDRAAALSIQGNEVAATPRRISNLGVDFRATDALQLGLQGRAQSNTYLEERNITDKYGSFAVLDLSAKYTVNPKMSVDVQVKNATAREYVYAWYDSFFQDTPQPMFSPSTGRAVFVGFTMKL